MCSDKIKRLGFSFTVIVLAFYYCEKVLLIKHWSIKKSILCVAMYSLVMSPCSYDLIVTSLVVKLISAWFLDSELSTCFW